MGDASITASASFITSGLSYGASGIIKNSIKDPIKQGVAEMGSNMSISVGVNTALRIVEGDDTTLFDVRFDGIGGMTTTGMDWTLSLDPPMSSLSRNVLSNMSALPLTNLYPSLKRAFGPKNDPSDLDKIKILAK